MYKKAFILLIVLFSFVGASSQGNLTAEQVLGKAVKMMANANGIESVFKVENSGMKGEGKIKTMGKKYHVVLPDVEVWYNGKDLYTYNKRTAETTVVTPTLEEISQSNPLSYITTIHQNFNVGYSKGNDQSHYVLELLPKTRNTDIKKVVLTLNRADFVPVEVVVLPVSGQTIKARITDFKRVSSLSTSDFEYPKSKYQNVEVIDLR